MEDPQNGTFVAEVEPGVKIIAGERYYTLPKFANVVGRSTRTVQRWCEKGFGPPRTKIGGLDLIAEKRIPPWMDSHTTEPVRPSRRRRKIAAETPMICSPARRR